MHILLIEDNLDLADNIIDYLELQDCEVTHASNGFKGLELATSSAYDALILDVTIPGKDGIAVCTELRNRHIEVPILMLTARDTLKDKLAGFKAGTDDYLTKPFSLEELFARLTALTRRLGKATGPETLEVGDLQMDLGTMEVRRAGASLTLNAACFKILKALMSATPNVVTRETIEEVLWGSWRPASDVLRTHIYELRRVVDKPFDGPPMIKTVRGVGYRII